jgi:hypothetical protein
VLSLAGLSSSSGMRLLVLVMVPLLSGCYFYKHVGGKTSAPDIRGTELRVKRDSGRYSVHCPGSRIEGCQPDSDGIWKKWRTYERIDVYAGNRRLNRGEVRALVSPEEHAKRWAAVEKHRGTCKLSAIPSFLALASAGVTVFGSAWAYKERDEVAEDEWTTAKTVGLVGLVGIAVFTIASYPIGGYACLSASSAMEESGLQLDDSTGYTKYDDNTGENLAEIEEVVARFNSQLANSGSADPAEEQGDTSTEPVTNETTPDPPAESPVSDTSCSADLISKGHETNPKKADKLCEKYSADQIARAEALRNFGIRDAFSRLLDKVADYNDAQLECAKKEWVERGKPGTFSVRKECK